MFLRRSFLKAIGAALVAPVASLSKAFASASAPAEAVALAATPPPVAQTLSDGLYALQWPHEYEQSFFDKVHRTLLASGPVAWDLTIVSAGFDRGGEQWIRTSYEKLIPKYSLAMTDSRGRPAINIAKLPSNRTISRDFGIPMASEIMIS